MRGAGVPGAGARLDDFGRVLGFSDDRTDSPFVVTDTLASTTSCGGDRELFAHIKMSSPQNLYHSPVSHTYFSAPWVDTFNVPISRNEATTISLNERTLLLEQGLDTGTLEIIMGCNGGSGK